MAAVRSILRSAIPIKKMKVSKNLIATIYGKSGSGKTTLAASSTSETNRALLLDMGEHGAVSIIDNDYLDIMNVDNTQDVDKIVTALETDDIYHTVIVDSVQTLSSIVIGQVRKVRSLAFVDDKNLTQAEWGQVSYYMVKFIVDMNTIARRLGKNMIYICDDREVVAPDGDSMFVPNLQASVERSLVGRSDCVIYTFIRSSTEGIGSDSKEITEFCANIGPSKELVAKVRKPKSVEVDSIVVDPTWDKIVDIINDSVHKRVPGEK